MLLLEDKYNEIAKLIYIPDQFGPDEEETCWELDDIYYDIRKHTNYRVNMSNGVSKCAFIFDELDYVMKLPFTGSYTETCIEGGYYDDDDGWVEGEYENEFVEFSNAETENGWDYCAVELDIYNKAVGTPFEKMFAKTYYGGETRWGHPYYLQEKAIPFDEDCTKSHTPSQNGQEKAKKIMEERSVKYYIPSLFLGYIVDLYGEDYCNRFIDYLRQNHISDLHGGNVGFSCIDDRPVILDSSSWHD